MTRGSDEPLIFDMCRGSFVDGPGIRSVVFFRGCPLRCPWCHNPEAWTDGGHPGSAQEIRYSPRALAHMLLRDKAYFIASGGGVTFSGGEPLMHIAYLREVCLLLKERGVHIAIETSGFFDCSLFTERLGEYVDLLLFDLKIADPMEHFRAIGAPNDGILANLRHLARAGTKITVTIPLIPGFTLFEKNLAALASVMAESGLMDYRLMPYNPSGIDKQISLGLEPDKRLRGKPLTLDEQRSWEDFFAKELARSR
jgi:pyruvate formate lyase activating enzyme